VDGKGWALTVKEEVSPIKARLRKKFLKVIFIPGVMISGIPDELAGRILHHI
jgi:hypothetical protein